MPLSRQPTFERRAWEALEWLEHLVVDKGVGMYKSNALKNRKLQILAESVICRVIELVDHVLERRHGPAWALAEVSDHG